MATIGIFTLKLGRMLLVCERDTAANTYFLTSQGFRTAMSLDSASALGGAAARIRWRARKAVDDRMKPGPIFGIQLPETKLVIGVADGGYDLYAEIGGEHIRLDERETEALLFALDRLHGDVDAIWQASAPPQQLNLTPGIVDWYYGRPPSW
jgi:hypothetical protein